MPTETPRHEKPPRSLGQFFNWRIIPAVLVTGLLLYVLIEYLGTTADLSQTIQRARPFWFGLAIGFMTCNILLATARFRGLLALLGKPPSYFETFDVVLSAWPLGLILPSRSNDLVRAFFLRDRIPVWQCTGAVVAERFVDLQSVLLVSLTGFIWLQKWLWALSIALAVATGWALLLVVSSADVSVAKLPGLSRFRERIEAVFEVFDQIKQTPYAMMPVVLYSITVWFVASGMIWALSASFRVSVPWAHALAYWPLASLIGMLPLTLGGVGTRDAAYIALAAGNLSLPASTLLAATVSYSAILFVFPAVIGIPLLIRHIIVPRSTDAPN